MHPEPRGLVSWPVVGREQPSPSWPRSSACRQRKELPGRVKQGNSEVMLQNQLLKGFPRVWQLGGGRRGAWLVLCSSWHRGSSTHPLVPGLCRGPGTIATARVAECSACRDARAGRGLGCSSTAGLGERFPLNHSIHPGRWWHGETSIHPSIHGSNGRQTHPRDFKTSFQSAEDLCTSHLICCSGHAWR